MDSRRGARFPAVISINLARTIRFLARARVTYNGTSTHTAAHSAQIFMPPAKRKPTPPIVRPKTTNCEDRQIQYSFSSNQCVVKLTRCMVKQKIVSWAITPRYRN